MWDLQRNGGNVVATTERILSGRGLEVPPQSFQPPLPVPASSTTSIAASPAQTRPLQPDLITRYNLKAQLAEEASKAERPEIAEEELPSNAKQQQAWSQNKVERHSLLEKKKAEMVLAARRKMEAQIAAEATAKGLPAV